MTTAEPQPVGDCDLSAKKVERGAIQESWLMSWSLTGSRLAMAVSLSPLLASSTWFVRASQKPESAANKRIEASRQVIDQIMSSRKTAIPNDVLSAAKCLGVVPSSMRVALGLGGLHRAGVITCRTTKGWSAPAPISLNGGRIGLQFAGQKNDIVIVVLDQNAFNELLLKRLKIGKDVVNTPGPLQGSKNAKEWRTSPILSYSQSHGVFAGFDLKGTSIRQDKNATVSLFGRYIPILSILAGQIPPPPESRTFLDDLRKYTQGARHDSG